MLTPLRETLLVVAAALTLAGCTSPRRGPADVATAATRPHMQTPLPPAVPGGGSAFVLASLDVGKAPPGAPLPAGEADGSCPYLRAGANIEPDPTGQDFADLEGNRVQRVTRLTTLSPVGCRFYFYADYHPVGDILPSTYASATAARNAMVSTAEAGTGARGVPAFLPGIDGVSFRTHLNAPDAGQDWAFAFAKGAVMVVVRTDQSNDTPANAENIAKAIASRF